MSVNHFQTELAQAVVDAGAVPLLVLCIQEPELSLKRIAASALSDISKHSPELAQTVVDAGAVAHLAQMILNLDAKLKVVSTYLPFISMFSLLLPISLLFATEANLFCSEPNCQTFCRPFRNCGGGRDLSCSSYLLERC